MLIFSSHHNFGLLDSEIFRKIREELVDSENINERQIEAESILIVDLVHENERQIKTKVAILLLAIPHLTGLGGVELFCFGKKGARLLKEQCPALH